jgi:hypothetical protein
MVGDLNLEIHFLRIPQKIMPNCVDKSPLLAKI